MENLDAFANTLVELVVRELMTLTPAGCGSAADAVCTECSVCATVCAHHSRNMVEAGATRIGARLGIEKIPVDIAQYIDHTLLKPEATAAEIDRLCDEAGQYHFAAVCVNPPFVKRCAERLRASGVAVAAVVGFPLGAHTTESKLFETQQAMIDGATEIDMVINVGALKAKNDGYVRDDIRAVVESGHARGGLVKVIIEAALLNDEEKIRACQLARDAGADFVKTSTGFGPGGATAHDVSLMRATVGPSIGVKAAGGVRTLAQAQQMIAAGATRIGASAGVTIVKEARDEAKPQVVAGGKS